MRGRVRGWCRAAAFGLPAVALALALPACSREGPTPRGREAVAPEIQQALIVAHRGLVEAFERGDTDGVCALLHPSQELLLFHPLLRGRFNSVEHIRKELPAMFAAMGRASWTEVHPMVVANGDVAWVTSNLLVEAEKLERPFVGRGTEIWVHEDGRWQLVHGHWSVLPEDRPQT